MNKSTIAFEGKELELIEWALGDMFDNAEAHLAQSKWEDKDLDAYCDRIFELLEKVRKARNS